MPALGTCLDCGKPTPKAPRGTGTRCPDHQRDRDQARNRARDARRATPRQRGYDTAHRRVRATWAPLVAAGHVSCARCGDRIAPDDRWDLGHPDDGSVGGPEHADRCNRAAGGRAAHR